MNHLAIALLSASLVVIGCAARSPKPPNGGADALRTQLDEDWKYWMTQYPELATAYGYPGQNMRWTDYSPAAIGSREDYLKKSFDRLKAIDRGQLNAEEQMNYDLYRDLLDTAVQGLAFHNDAIPVKNVIPHNLFMPINQIEGIQQDIPPRDRDDAGRVARGLRKHRFTA